MVFCSSLGKPKVLSHDICRITIPVAMDHEEGSTASIAD